MSEAAIPLAIGGTASALGNYFGAQTAANASKRVAQLQQQRYEQAAGYAQPFIQGGQNALNLYNNAIGANGAQAQEDYYANFQNDPGFQASVNYGLNRIQASNAARGMTLSGNTLAALQDYSQKNLLDAYHTRLADLFREAQLGAGSANALTSASMGNAQANYTLSAGQYQGSQLSNLGNSLYGAAKDYSSYYYGAQSRNA